MIPTFINNNLNSQYNAQQLSNKALEIPRFLAKQPMEALEDSRKMPP